MAKKKKAVKKAKSVKCHHCSEAFKTKAALNKHLKDCM
jgi:hypothetical protein